MDFKKREQLAKKKKMVSTKPTPRPRSRWNMKAMSGLPWRRITSWSGKALLLALIPAALFGLSSWVPEWMDRYPIQRIQVLGDFQYVQRADMEQRLQPYLAQNYFNVALKKMKQDAEQIPWVQSVKITKSWPDKVEVRIQERVAIAVWNEKFLVSHKGELFAPKNIAKHEALPRLYGQQKQVRKVMESYQQFNQVMRPLDLEIVELKLEPRLSWSGKLDNGLELLVDRQQSLEKLKRFAKLYRQLSEVEPKMAKVDLRYRQGLAVTWNENI